MKSNMTNPAISMRNQQGAVLIVGLVMVLLISIVSLASIRGSNLQENMAGNMRDRNVAFQAAESAIREAEAVIARPSELLPEFNNTDGNFQDFEATPGNSVLLLTQEQWETNAKKTELNLSDVSEEPSYIIEQIAVGNNACADGENSGVDVVAIMSTGSCVPYRVTSKSTGGNPNTVVILQSTYKRRF